MTQPPDGYPEKTCSIDRLVTHPKLVAAALSGTKTQQRRAACIRGWNGTTSFPFGCTSSSRLRAKP